ncbi:MAG: hypothetical protein QMC24_07230 [Akkermansiaceae bacterium]|jgi:hypothetical protein
MNLRLLTLTALLGGLSLQSVYSQRPLQFQNVNNFRIPNQAGDDEILDLPESDPSGTDLLRFTNGDIMHGNFAGLKDGILWNRPDIDEPIRFELKNLRQVVFDGGNNSPAQPKSPFVSLVNGDEIPGKIISLDEKALVIDSPLTGQISIPRDQLKTLNPNPFGGQLHYAGPFSSDQWVMIDTEKEEVTEPEEKKAEEKKEEDEEKPKPNPSWLYSGASLYSTNTRAVALDGKLPDVGRLRFKIAWRNSFSSTVAFHADFKRPLPRKEVALEPEIDADAGKAEDQPIVPEEAKEPEPLKYQHLFDLKKGNAFQSLEWLPANTSSGHPQTYGSSYVFNFSSSYVNLWRCSFDEDGKPSTKSLRNQRLPVNLGQSGEAEFDLRFDRTKNAIYLYVNGLYASQWNDLDGYVAPGDGLAFAGNGNSRIRVSDILITSWSGTPDGARSLEHEDRDIVLLTNGTDRFSGQITSIADGKATLKGPYADLTLPLDELSEIHFQRSGLADLQKIKWPDDTGILLFNPIGRISLVPTSSDKNHLSGKSPVLGDLKVKLDSAALLQFAETPDVLSDWVTDF